MSANHADDLEPADDAPAEEWNAWWKGRCGHCGIKPPVHGFEGGDCPLHPVYVPLGPATTDRPVLTHGPCREIERWHSLHHCAAFGKAFVSRYSNDAHDGWEWGTYCCCGRCEVVGHVEVVVPAEQLELFA